MHASKMSAIGKMAGGIAHEINSPLAAISLEAEFIESSLPTNSTLTEHVKNIQNTVGRISKIILGLKQFTHGGKKGEQSQTTIGEIISDTLSFCGEKIKGSSVELRRNRESEHVQLSCQPEQISQVLLNLINNAIDALSESREKWISITAEVKEKKILIYVEDSGSGIPEELRAKIMQPFFTTKVAGKGTGLGLSISRTILESHSGKLWLDSDSARTRFIMELPANVS